MLLRVNLGGLLGVMTGVRGMAPRRVSVVSCLLVISGLVVFGCFRMVPRDMRSMFCCLLMVFCSLFGHGSASSTDITQMVGDKCPPLLDLSLYMYR